MDARRIALTTLLVLLTAQVAPAQWSENGAPTVDASWRKSDGDLGAMLMVTDDFGAFLEQWNRPTAPGYSPNVSAVDAAKRGNTVTAFILFHGCAANEAHVCRTMSDWRVLRPDGSVYADHAGTPVWDAAPPPDGHLQLALARLTFEIELDDPLGRYQIEASVLDPVSGRTVALVRTLDVTD